jgi:hypothetical protein
MVTLSNRRRGVCSSCGNRCKVYPVELLVHIIHDQLRYWRWCNATLCPPCRVAHYDWWRLRAEKGVAYAG